MVKMINRRLGTVMMVDEKRVDEYLAKGHTLAEPPAKKPQKKPASKKKGTAKK